MLRLFASLAVFVGHANAVFFTFSHTGIISGHARESVATFFVLSGFVIRYVVSKKERSWGAYAVARVSRLYPTALFSVALIFILDTLGQNINRDYYSSVISFRPETFGSAFTYVTFTNQLWFSHVIFGSGEPNWSLGFEVWYYVFFGLAMFLPRRFVAGALIAWGIFCGPKILAYLALWLLGVASYDMCCRRAPFQAIIALAALVITPCLYGIIWHFVGKSVGNMYENYDFEQEVKNFAYFMSIGLVVSVNIVAFNFATCGVSLFPSPLAKTIRWLAGASFTLYLIHLPLFTFLAGLLPSSRVSVSAGIGCCVLTLATALGVAELIERRKQYHARLLWSLIDKVGRRLSKGNGRRLTSSPTPGDPT